MILFNLENEKPKVAYDWLEERIADIKKFYINYSSSEKKDYKIQGFTLRCENEVQKIANSHYAQYRQSVISPNDQYQLNFQLYADLFNQLVSIFEQTFLEQQMGYLSTQRKKFNIRFCFSSFFELNKEQSFVSFLNNNERKHHLCRMIGLTLKEIADFFHYGLPESCVELTQISTTQFSEKYKFKPLNQLLIENKTSVHGAKIRANSIA